MSDIAEDDGGDHDKVNDEGEESLSSGLDLASKWMRLQAQFAMRLQQPTGLQPKPDLSPQQSFEIGMASAASSPLPLDLSPLGKLTSPLFPGSNQHHQQQHPLSLPSVGSGLQPLLASLMEKSAWQALAETEKASMAADLNAGGGLTSTTTSALSALQKISQLASRQPFNSAPPVLSSHHGRSYPHSSSTSPMMAPTFPPPPLKPFPWQSR